LDRLESQLLVERRANQDNQRVSPCPNVKTLRSVLRKGVDCLC
jgi:hypothetical protein